MVYLDTSVALAQLLAEARVPPEALWDEPLISSRLIEYELWTRIHTSKLARSHCAYLIGFTELLDLPARAR